VVKVRDEANRVRCQNNVKQLLLAADNYAATYGFLPPGTMPNPGLPVERRLSWFVALVPFVEADNLYSLTDKKAAWDSPKNLEVLGIPYFYVRCAIIPRDDPRPIATHAGVTGLGADSPILPVEHSRAGVFGYDRKTPRNAVKDGESNAMLMMESGREPGPWARGGEGTLTWFDPANPPHAGPGRPFGLPHVAERPLFSRRVHGGLVGFADASVRTFRDTVSPGVLEAPATIAGGESVVIPD
jgi:hypothetical protein